MEEPRKRLLTFAFSSDESANRNRDFDLEYALFTFTYCCDVLFLVGLNDTEEV